MKIRDSWDRIAGLHVENQGEIAAVWFAHDPDSNVIHLYDSVIFRREVLAVIAEGLKARGTWIPIAWERSGAEIVGKLKERGCKMLKEGYKDSDAVAEIASRDLWQRMRTGQFKVERSNAEWLDEYRSFYREDGQVPQDAFPLMSATRHAIYNLKKARSGGKPKSKIHYDNAGII